MSVSPIVDHRRGASIRSRVVFGAARLMLRPVLTYWPLANWALRPLPLLDLAAGLLPRPRGVTVDRVAFGDYVGEWVRTGEPQDDGVVLYFHGGAFITCGLGTHRYAAAAISAAAGLPVLSVGYRHLPAVPLTGSVADCVDVYRWLLQQGVAPDRVVLAGDSAGGHLAFATALRVRDEGLPGPAGIVALSPWLDFDITAKLAHPNAGRDAYAPVKRLPRLAWLCAGGCDPDPELSPVNGDLTGLPPVLLMVSESEILRCDAELMAERLGAADVPCTLQIWEGQVHAFPVLVDLLPESRAAITEVGAFVRQVTALPALTEVPALPGDEELPALAG